MKKTFVFNKDSRGNIPFNIYGDGFEFCCKFCLDRKNAEKRSAAGRSDFKYGKNYDTKQNGSPIQYAAIKRKGYISGSSRVIYATHIAYEIVNETDTTVEIFIDLANTDMWVVDKKEFVEFLLNGKGLVKDNPKKDQLNIQTLWNYKKGAYHGAKYKVVEGWLDEHQLVDDTIIEDILDGFYSKCL